MVSSSTAPLVLLDGDLTVVAASASFFSTFQINPIGATGEPLFSLGDGEWDLPRLRSLLTATLSGAADVKAYELEIRNSQLGKRCLVLNAHLLSFGDGSQLRLLLGLADVTDAKAAEKLKDDLLREKAIPVTGGPAPRRQQPADHCQRHPAERPQNPVRRDPHPPDGRP